MFTCIFNLAVLAKIRHRTKTTNLGQVLYILQLFLTYHLNRKIVIGILILFSLCVALVPIKLIRAIAAGVSVYFNEPLKKKYGLFKQTDSRPMETIWILKFHRRRCVSPGCSSLYNMRRDTDKNFKHIWRLASSKYLTNWQTYNRAPSSVLLISSIYLDIRAAGLLLNVLVNKLT